MSRSGYNVSAASREGFFFFLIPHKRSNSASLSSSSSLILNPPNINTFLIRSPLSDSPVPSLSAVTNPLRFLETHHLSP